LRHLISALLILSACASARHREPESYSFARTQQQKSAADPITYRTLEVADFRAAEPPPGTDLSTSTAAICTSIRVHVQTPMDLRLLGDGRVRASVRELRFQATMDRNCSWWGERAAVSAASTLLRMQVHFGITEVHARSLVAFREDMEGRSVVIAETREAATEALMNELNALCDEHNGVLERRLAQFNAEVSGDDVVALRRWHETILRELAETAPNAAAPRLQRAVGRAQRAGHRAF
jgi:hypothetical protein